MGKCGQMGKREKNGSQSDAELMCLCGWPNVDILAEGCANFTLELIHSFEITNLPRPLTPLKIFGLIKLFFFSISTRIGILFRNI